MWSCKMLNGVVGECRVATGEWGLRCADQHPRATCELCVLRGRGVARVCGVCRAERGGPRARLWLCQVPVHLPLRPPRGAPGAGARASRVCRDSCVWLSLVRRGSCPRSSLEISMPLKQLLARALTQFIFMDSCVGACGRCRPAPHAARTRTQEARRAQTN